MRLTVDEIVVAFPRADRLSQGADNFLDGKRGVTDLPMLAVARDPDPAARIIVIRAVAQFDDFPTLGAERWDGLGCADTEVIWLAGAVGSNRRRPREIPQSD